MQQGREGAGNDAMMDGRNDAFRTHAGVPQQCLGWMNRRGAAPGAVRERGGEKRRGLTEPKPGSAGDRGTQRLRQCEAHGALCLSGGHLRDRSLCDCPKMGQCSQGHDRTGQDRTGEDRLGQQVGGVARGSLFRQNDRRKRFHREHHTSWSIM